MSWAIFGDELVKLYHRGTHYKPRDMRTDTAYCVHGKQAFHNMITMLHFATNSRVKEKDMADCRCSRCMFYGVINMQKPALKTRVPRKQIARAHCRKKTVGTHNELACHGNRYCAHRSRHKECKNLLETSLSHVSVLQITRLMRFPPDIA